MADKYLKNLLISSVVLALLLIAPVVLAAASPYPGIKTAVGGTGLNSDVLVFVGGLIKGVLSLLGVVFVLVLIYAGIMWGFLSANDPKKVQTAKELIKNAVIGLVIVFAAYGITTLVMTSLSQAASGSV